MNDIKDVNKVYIVPGCLIVLCVILGIFFSKRAASVKTEQAAKLEEQVKLEKRKAGKSYRRRDCAINKNQKRSF